MLADVIRVVPRQPMHQCISCCNYSTMCLPTLVCHFEKENWGNRANSCRENHGLCNPLMQVLEKKATNGIEPRPSQHPKIYTRCSNHCTILPLVLTSQLELIYPNTKHTTNPNFLHVVRLHQIFMLTSTC
jgi:hypothetical protein